MVVDRHKGQNQSKRYRRVQRQAGLKTIKTSEKENGEKQMVDFTNIQDELAQRDRKHRDKYNGGNKRHLEVVETITGTGETDQGETVYRCCC